MTKTQKLVTWSALGLALFAVAVCLYPRYAQVPITGTATNSALRMSREPGQDPWFALAAPRRAIYPYSVIPGGVQSLVELKQIIRDDPEMGKHLKDFDLLKAKLVRIENPRAAYVSYRIGDRIFWTAKRLTLAKGEIIITDGTHTIRGRCGNDISDVPVRPILPRLEPSSTRLNTPLPPPDDPLPPVLTYLTNLSPEIPSSSLPVLPLAFQPAVDPTIAPLGGLPLYPPFIPLGGGGDAASAVTPTPEPATLALLFFSGAVMGLWSVCVKFKRLKRSM